MRSTPRSTPSRTQLVVARPSDVRLLALVGPGLLLGLLAGSCRRADGRVSGTVEARRVTISSELGARVLAVHKREGASVRAGEPLVELDCALPLAQRAEAAARLELARAELALLEAGSRSQELDDARAARAQAEAQLEVARTGARQEQIDQLLAQREEVQARIVLARITSGRTSALAAKGAGAQAESDEAVAELHALEATARRLEAELTEARAGARREEVVIREREVERAAARLSLLEEGARREELQAARARVAAAAAALEEAEQVALRCTLLAPVDGSVEIVDVEPGELALPGTPLLALARGGPLRVRTFAPQEVIGRLAVGDTLAVTVDGHTRAVSAQVERIYDQAEFTAGNVQTPEDRMLLVYRVDLLADPAPEAGLRAGASVLVDFRSGQPGSP